MKIGKHNLVWLACGLLATVTCTAAFACDHVSAPAAVRASANSDVLGTSGSSAGSAASGFSLVRPHPAPIVIPRLTAKPALGDFLGSNLRFPATKMLRVANFVQRYPDYGSRPQDKTAAFLGYTHNYLFVAFICHDKDPKLVRAHMLQRDSLHGEDHVRVMLDTFHDQRHAFVFESNPLGIQADALFTEQNGMDFSFDTVWSTWGRRTPFGYVVLMRIPFASLYFSKAAPGAMRTWGIILQRSIAHTDESDFWPRSDPNIAGQLTQDAAVEGFENIEHGQNLQFEPYAIARSLRRLNTANSVNPYFENKHLQGYSGLDAKFILHNSLVLDTTINPDFSQVGIDDPAAPNQRFPPFFPEVRPFFIENSSYFTTPISLYYTNKIVRPQYGARLTGKLGPWAMGVLDVDDISPGKAVPPSDPLAHTRAHFYIGRLDRDIGPHSNAGIIYADREYLGSFNRAGGVDYRARVGTRWTFTGQAITSQTKNLSDSPIGEQGCMNGALTCSGQAFVQRISYSDLHRGWWFAYHDTSAGFLTDTGFFTRPDVRMPSTGFSYTFLPDHGPVLSNGPSVYLERIWDHHGLPLDFFVHPAYRINFKNRTSLFAYLSLGQDRLRPIDYSALTKDVEYDTRRAGLHFHTSPVPFLSAGAGFYTGRTINYSPPDGEGPQPVDVASPDVSFEIKPVGSMDLDNSYVYTHFTNPQTGNVVYNNHELISRWNYQFTKAISLNLIGQYIATLPHTDATDASNSKNLFADALLTYMPHPGTAVYLGYIGNFANLNRTLCTRMQNGQCNGSYPILPTTTSTLMNDSKNLYLKVSYLLRF